MLVQIGSLISGTLLYTMPILITAMGLLVAERAGVLNIGGEGIMLMGAISAAVVGVATGSTFLGIVAAVIVGGVFALVYAFLVVTVRADQVVVGTGINMLGLGLSALINTKVLGSTSDNQVNAVKSLELSFFEKVPLIGDFLTEVFSQNIIVYAFVFVIIITNIVLFKTEIGLKIRAVGEHPKACDVVGINVYKIRYGTIIYSGLLAGLGGAYFAVVINNFFINNMIVGNGFMALAVIVVGRYMPIGVLLASILFGGSRAIADFVQAFQHIEIPPQVFQMVPYIITVVAICLLGNLTVDPAAKAKPYIKEEA